MIRLVFVVCAGVAAGCAGVGGTSSARVLPPGQREVTVGPEINGAGPGNVAVPTPEGSVGMRIGVGGRVDVDARLTTLPAGKVMTTFGLEGGVKRQLRSGERLDIAVGARASYRLIHSSGASWEGIAASVPVSFGINLRGGRDQLVLAPRLGIQRWYSSGAMPVDLPFGGAAIGYSWQINQRFAIFPEVSVMRSSTEFSDKKSTILIHTGVGFSFSR